jgi:hypothetical protein
MPTLNQAEAISLILGQGGYCPAAIRADSIASKSQNCNSLVHGEAVGVGLQHVFKPFID